MINGVPVEKAGRTINSKKYSKIKHSLYSEEQSEVFANIAATFCIEWAISNI
jgi:hypothetical protein